MAEPEKPLERIEVVALANGARVDIWAHHPPSGEQRLIDRNHYLTLALARQFAGMLSKATGSPILEAGQ